jgi:hypothetical protein
MWQSKDWIGADTLVAATDQKGKIFDQFDANADWFANVDYCLIPCPCMLAWQHAQHFIKVYPEEEIVFCVLYDDKYNNAPSEGYPRVTYWADGAQQVSTAMDLAGNQESRMLYVKKVTLGPGTYHYRYTVRNGQFPSDYSLDVSSFVVTRRPGKPDNAGLPDSSTVSNSKIILTWNPPENGECTLTYRLFAGTDPERLSLIYEGSQPNYQLTMLEYGTKYYWQVESVNTYGVSSRSTVFNFDTISRVTHAFNYPNPFNPIQNQHTNIVFDMADNGYADVAIYTEFGDLCWSKTFIGLLKNANEISYDGKDDRGRTLYNGTYLCLIKKKYPDREENDRCRILVLK